MKKQGRIIRHYCSVILLLMCCFMFFACDNGSSSKSDRADNAGPELDDYLPGKPAPLTTTFDSISESSGGEAIHISLDDGTDAYIPELEAPYEAILERDNVEADLEDLIASLPRRGRASLEMTGSLRRLVVTGSGDPSDLKPVITIPAGEAGTVNLETINVLRVGDLFVEGELIENHVMLLPASVDDIGDLRFIDPLMPDGVVAVDHPAGAPILAQSPLSGRLVQSAPAGQTAWVGNTRYLLMTFENDLNWQQDPQLVRMVPYSSASGYRRPATDPEIREMAENPICNVVILVHGHNDSEKAGFEDDTEVAPWRVNYKRLVWDLMYQTIDEAEDYGAVYPLDCTAFYEFIYPTYRPIFSPVLDKTGWSHETLGQAMGRLVEREIRDNPQLKAMIDNDMPFNLLVASHSMGGLVARAGFRHMPEAFVKNLQGFVSWGSPHRGAALYSFRYALSAGHDLVWQGVKLPLQNIGTSEGYQNFLDVLALDTPSKRDMRWDAANKGMLRFDDPALFQENSTSIMVSRDMELPDGDHFFSRNMTSFSESEGAFMGGLLDDKYMLFHGTTSKRAEVETVRSSWFPWASTFWRFKMGSTPIEQGAFLNDLVMKEGYKANDGAVPLYSQQARNLDFRVADIQRIDMEDTDHEEFYGAEHPQRNAETIAKGKNVARWTYHYLGMNTLSMAGRSRRCPTIEYESLAEGDNSIVTGRLVFRLYDEDFGGDEEVGRRIDRFEARAGGPDGSVVRALSFTHEDDGSFHGEGPADSIRESIVYVVAVLKDKSEVWEEVELRNPLSGACGVDFDWSMSSMIGEGSSLEYYILWETGLWHGPYTHYYFGKQTVRNEGCYADGIRVGWQESFYENGRQRWKRFFEDGKVVGPYERWWDNGRRMTRGTVYEPYEPGDNIPRSEPAIIAPAVRILPNTNWDGQVETWYEDGKRGVVAPFSQGLSNGKYERWYENGRKEIEANYREGTLHGSYTTWDDDGNITAKGTYTDGSKTGTWLERRWGTLVEIEY